KIINQQKSSEIDLILIACTGNFDYFISEIPIVYPDKLVCDVLNNILNTKKNLGVLVPDKKQKFDIDKKWEDFNINTTNFYISPYQYSNEKINQVAKEINKAELKYIICDCIGYNENLKSKLSTLTDKKVILSKDI